MCSNFKKKFTCTFRASRESLISSLILNLRMLLVFRLTQALKFGIQLQVNFLLLSGPANTFEAPNTIEVPMFGAWRIIFAQNHLIVCGDLGRISFYDVVSREIVKKMDVGDHFMTAINKSQNEKRILFGNANGDVYLLKT